MHGMQPIGRIKSKDEYIVSEDVGNTSKVGNINL